MAVIAGVLEREKERERVTLIKNNKEDKVTNNVALLAIFCQNRKYKRRLMLG